MNVKPSLSALYWVESMSENAMTEYIDLIASILDVIVEQGVGN